MTIAQIAAWVVLGMLVAGTLTVIILCMLGWLDHEEIEDEDEDEDEDEERRKSHEYQRYGKG